MIDPAHPRLSIVRQCGLVGISHSSYYYQGKGESLLNLQLMRLIDEKRDACGASQSERPHFSLDQQTPDQAYFGGLKEAA